MYLFIKDILEIVTLIIATDFLDQKNSSHWLRWSSHSKRYCWAYKVLSSIPRQIKCFRSSIENFSEAGLDLCPLEDIRLIHVFFLKSSVSSAGQRPPFLSFQTSLFWAISGHVCPANIIRSRTWDLSWWNLMSEVRMHLFTSQPNEAI